jgi:ribose transport system substrate-binding protein
MNRHPLVAAAIAASVAVTLAACSSNASAPSSSGTAGASGVRIAEVTANTSDPFWQTVSCAIHAEAAARGAKVTSFNSTSTDTNAIASNFNTALLGSPQGVIVSPFNNNQFASQYRSLMAKGVPVVTGNGTTPPAEYRYFASGTDTARFASTVAAAVPSGAGSMVFLGGAPGIPPLEQRTKPFVTAIQKSRSDLKVLPTDYSGFDINKETTTVASLILAHPDLKLIIAADGPDGQGAAAAIKQAGKAGKITLVAFDATPAEVSALKAGTIQFLIAQAPGKIGRAEVDAIVDYLKAHPGGGAVPVGTAPQYVANQLLTKADVDKPANADFVYRSTC